MTTETERNAKMIRRSIETIIKAAHTAEKATDSLLEINAEYLNIIDALAQELEAIRDTDAGFGGV